ncbi:unnamed protein product [Anisakis simplex]|uniref:LSM14 domain-containing protein n=1 Tax=Anisakis simplex TaxID=6269 RepID=A0A0M3KBY3_ANISI|nr:unnamed protein product [Anisakis simplex]
MQVAELGFIGNFVDGINCLRVVHCNSRDTIEAVIKSKDVQMEKPELAKSTRSSGRESQSPPNRLSLKSENQADASNSQRPEQTPQGLSKAFF